MSIVPPKSPGIYLIKCTANNKVYVGSSANIYVRWQSHRCSLKANQNYSSLLQRAYNRYGKDALEYSVIELCDVSKLLEREQYWMQFYRCTDRRYGLNIHIKPNSALGIKRTEEQRARMREAQKGYKPSEATRKALREATKGKIPPNLHDVHQKNKGSKRTDEQRAKMSQWQIGRKMSDEARANMSVAQTNRFSIQQVTQICLVCKREFTYRLTSGNKNRKFCSRSCSAKAMHGGSTDLNRFRGTEDQLRA